MEPGGSLSNRNSAVVIIGLVLIVIMSMVTYGLLQKKNSEVKPSAASTSFSTPIAIPTEVVPTYSPTVIVKPPTTYVYSPEETTRTFYQWYMSTPGNVVNSGLYKSSLLLTDYYKNLIEESSAGYSNEDAFDPIFCTKNKTKDFSIGAAQYTKNRQEASVLIYQTHGVQDIYRVVLVKEGGTWKIKDIMCRN